MTGRLSDDDDDLGFRAQESLKVALLCTREYAGECPYIKGYHGQRHRTTLQRGASGKNRFCKVSMLSVNI